MKQKLSVLGATGSIGTQTLEVAESCGMQVVALTTNKNATLLEVQARKFKPELVAAADLTAAADLKQRLRDTNIRVVGGEAGILEAATMGDTVVVAVVGIAGLDPTLAAIDAGKRIALANKETMVCAGDLVMKRAAEKNVDIVPVDSEHSAIFQCLQGNRAQDVKRLILTASGGPFFGKGREELEHMTPAQALKHPNWTMGAKVTIDSATLMNKGLEFLEAMALFSVPPEKISIVVHRESIIHSLVEYCDHAMLAQLGTADMRLPIQYALTWKDRSVGTGTALDLLTLPPLTFAAPDLA
ncbi:MAG: 1-deoxy-D-xylulose-5-phosphate reductoisomerase, partial [Evtepia sp.]